MPTEIGRYRIERRLGSGAFATVWLAEDAALESWVAIKILADNWAHHPDVRARFEQEAQILRRADSGRLVRVLDIGELPDGRPYLVMTYAAGGTLAERLLVGPMPVERALRTAADIARAVTVLHEVGVLHRDLKPSNVLYHTVAGQERVLVADLGLAKAIAHASGFTVVAGTPGYMAPEQARPGGGLDARADVHAIGAMAYQMLTGHPPNAVESARASADRTVPAAPSKLRPGIPAHVDRIVLRALQPEPDRRWASAAAFAEALSMAADAPPARPGTRAPARLRRLAASAVAAVVVLAAGGSAAAGATAPGWVRVADASAALSVAVPAQWAGQLKDTHWNPAAIGLPDGQAPGLLIGTDLGTWTDQQSPYPGVFAGVSAWLRPGQAAPALPTHDQCTRQPDRQVSVGGMAGRVRRWTACGRTSISFSEVVLTAGPGHGVYLEIKQVGGTDLTGEVLHSLRLNGAATAGVVD